MAIIKDVTVKINNGTATLDAPVQFYEKDHDVELRFRLMDYKYKYDKDPQNILNSVDEDVLEAYTTIVNPRGYELEQINGVIKNDTVIFRLDPTYTDELDELGTYKLQIHIKCTHSEFTIPPITFEVLQRLKGIKVVTDGEDEVDNSEILDNSSKFVSDETGKLIIEWKKGDMISSAKLNAMVDVINDAVDEEVIRQANEKERERKAANKIQELENTRVEYVNKFDTELDSFADQVDESMTDYETRFNALTVSQQQDAEVIDARDGEQTLRARLERDIQKPSNIYEEVEGSHINVDTTSGYAQNIEILGNTIQNQNDLADIRSVGDKVENQELYEIPVLITGKKLFDVEIVFKSNVSTYVSQSVKLKAGVPYVLSKKQKGISIRTAVFYSDGSSALDGYLYANDMFTPIKDDTYTFKFSRNSAYLDQEGVYNMQLEEGTVATEYEPYQQHKLTILSPVQLEKVGDVADKIVEKDGVWGVEKNVNTLKITENEDWRMSYGSLTAETRINTRQFYINSYDNLNLGKESKPICNKFNYGEPVYDKDIEGMSFITSGTYRLRIGHTSKSVDEFKEWLRNNDVFVKYPTTQPQFIPLPYDQQVKLRTFANKTNISFGCEIEPTLKASVPKSIGASVSSNSDQIGNLSKELEKINNEIDNINSEVDNINNLEESIVSTVTSESDFTTVENTNNGYFDDVKLEGRTLVNLAQKNKINLTTNNKGYINYFSTNIEHFKSNTTYTVIIDVLKNNGCKLIGAEPNNNYCLKSVYLSTSITSNSIGRFIDKITTVDISSCTSVMRTYVENTIGEGAYIEANIMILEGDHTQNPPSYFEGLKSVGQDVDEISVLTQNKEETKENEKRILYYNEETQTWEKPILREWDSIEKHSDGKYYYHKRSGEVVLNGSEPDWKLHTGDGNRTTVGMETTILSKYNEQNPNVIDIICDKLLCISAGDSYETDLVGVASRLNLIRLRLDPTKVGGTDLISMKAWLQVNPITVVYKLAQEEVYECTNLDLITYADETNLLVKSGVLNSKVSLKVSNGVGNVVTMLQNKVTMLEQMVYDLMKMFNNQQSNIDE